MVSNNDNSDVSPRGQICCLCTNPRKISDEVINVKSLIGAREDIPDSDFSGGLARESMR